MTLTQLQQEAREEFEKLDAHYKYHAADNEHINRLVAHVYAAALDSVEGGIEVIESDPPNDTIDTTTGFHQATEEMTRHLRTLREGITGNEHVK